jgi:hypothetical protein
MRVLCGLSYAGLMRTSCAGAQFGVQWGVQSSEACSPNQASMCEVYSLLAALAHASLLDFARNVLCAVLCVLCGRSMGLRNGTHTVVSACKMYDGIYIYVS